MTKQPERRAAPRDHKLVRVFVSDPADALDEVYTGWITDRSKGGICLSFPRLDADAGNVLMVQPVSTTEGLPWVEVRIKHRRCKANRVEFGCEFVHLHGWERTLLLG
ncbi:MAG: PilZ domain-containing protein [Gemmataceae bacterium]|nr:PilZ domain-containing protein [Gemmataceae bacterium]